MIYVGKSYTARLRGSRAVPVQCEKCQTCFVYELIREGTGAGSAPYYIGQAAAARRAEEGARKMLKKRLARESEPVACPNCNWVNSDLIAGFKRTQYRRLAIGGVSVGLILGLFVFIGVNVSEHRHDDNTAAALISGGITALLIGGGCIALRRVLRKRIDPNRTFPNPPKLPAGTPKGYTDQNLASVRTATQSGRFVPPDPQVTEFPDWVAFRSGHLALPPVCCECLAPATAWLKSASANALDAFAVPVCQECDSRIKATKRWVILQVVIGVGLIAAIAFFASSGKTESRVMTSVIAGIVALIVGVVIAATFGRPFKLKTVDAARGVFRLKFRSEQYTEMVRQATAAHEAAPFQPPVPAIPLNNN